MKPSSSYPYFRIAREIGLPYWAVLTIAEHRMKGGDIERVWVPIAMEAIRSACPADEMQVLLDRVDAAIAEFRIIQAEGWD